MKVQEILRALAKDGTVEEDRNRRDNALLHRIGQGDGRARGGGGC